MDGPSVLLGIGLSSAVMPALSSRTSLNWQKTAESQRARVFPEFLDEKHAQGPA